MPKMYDSLFHVWEISCQQCGCGVSLTGCHVLQVAELKCPGCQRLLDLFAIKTAVKASVQLEAATFRCFTQGIVLAHPCAVPAKPIIHCPDEDDDEDVHEIVRWNSLQDRAAQDELAYRQSISDEECLSLTQCVQH